MSRFIPLLTATALFFISAGSVYAQGTANKGKSSSVVELQRRIELLDKQRLVLNKDLAESRKKEVTAQAEVQELRTRLQSLGMYDGDGNEKLIQAISDGRVLNDQLTALRDASESTLNEMKNFIQVAQVSDPNKRARLEGAIRKLESILIGVDRSKRGIDQSGNLKNARVISIDSESGVLVLNIGSRKDSSIGQRFTFSRGDRPLGEGIIAEVRPSISGVLLVSKVSPDVQIKVGDTASIIVQR